MENTPGMPWEMADKKMALLDKMCAILEKLWASSDTLKKVKEEIMSGESEKPEAGIEVSIEKKGVSWSKEDLANLLKGVMSY